MVAMWKMIIRGLGMTFYTTKNVSLCLFPPYLVYVTYKIIPSNENSSRECCVGILEGT